VTGASAAPSAGAKAGDAAASVSFLVCVEAGKLEEQALLLVRSIRRFWGSLADAPIFAVSPRAAHQPSAATQIALAELDVRHIGGDMNTEFADYGMANKFAAGRWAEAHAETDVIVFVDSDTFFAQEPTAFRLPAGIDLALRPADKKDKGSTGPGDEREPYWEQLYQITGVTARPWVDSGVDRQRIHAYFNGGLVVARRSAGIFSAWWEDFLALERAGHEPPEGIGFMDMLSLAATSARRWDRTQVLDWHYNYPLPMRPLLPEPARSAPLESLIHIHYHRWFARPGFLDLFEPPIPAATPVRRWLDPQLPLHPEIKGIPEALREQRSAARETRRAGRKRRQGPLRRLIRSLTGR
jgi:hypothetical protein